MPSNGEKELGEFFKDKFRSVMSGLDLAKTMIEWSVGISLPRRRDYVQILCIQPDEAGRGPRQ